MDTIHAMPGHLIRRAQQVSVAIFAEECGGFDLTSVQYAALRAVGETPGLDATRLAALIVFDRSTIGDVLERMEGKGWIERLPSGRDRRIKLLRITDQGRQLLTEVGPAVLRVQERLLAPFPEQDRAALLRLLSRLATAHDGLNPGMLTAVPA